MKKVKSRAEGAVIGVLTLGMVLSASGDLAYIGGSDLGSSTISAGTTNSIQANITIVDSQFSQGYLIPDGTASLTLKEVNYWAVNTGTFTPFVAIYSGDATEAQLEAGDNYTVVWSSPVTVTEAQTSVTATFSDEITDWSVGDLLVAGLYSGSGVGVVGWRNGSPGYYGNGNTIPGSQPNTLTGDGIFGQLTRDFTFNIQLESTVVPEPASLALVLVGGMCALRLRHRRG